MKMNPCDATLKDMCIGNKNNKMLAALEEFMAMDCDVVSIDPVENGYSSTESCRSSLRNAIKKYKFTNIKTSCIRGVLYMYKT